MTESVEVYTGSPPHASASDAGLAEPPLGHIRHLEVEATWDGKPGHPTVVEVTLTVRRAPLKACTTANASRLTRYALAPFSFSPSLNLVTTRPLLPMSTVDR